MPLGPIAIHSDQIRHTFTSILPSLTAPLPKKRKVAKALVSMARAHSDTSDDNLGEEKDDDNTHTPWDSDDEESVKAPLGTPGKRRRNSSPPVVKMEED